MHLVQEIGSYAGFAAVVGLAVLSALYFSQARDVKRLREWAGRAPERAAEEEARIKAAAQAQAVRQQPPQRAAAVGEPRPAVIVPRPGVPAGTQPPPGVPAGGGGDAHRPPQLQTSILSPGARPRDPWYRRLEPKYMALIVAGVLVIGGGAAYGVTRLTASDSGGAESASPHSARSAGQVRQRRPARVVPAEVTFAVLNGTTVNGAANRVADQLEAKGYVRGNVLTSTDQGRAESVVEYSDGNIAAARAIGRQLGIAQFEKVDPQTQLQAGDATVVVILGADKASQVAAG